jgi:predicted amidohydrolase
MQFTHVVAAVQFEPRAKHVEENLALAKQLAFEAAAKGARLIVLPELCISGYDLPGPREAAMCAQTRDGYQTQAFIPIAQQFNCHIAFGYVELLEGKLYNSAAIIGPCGLMGNAQKHNLWGTDFLWATPSEALAPVVITHEGRLGALICSDAKNNYRSTYAHKNEGFKYYHKGSVDVIALLTNWGGEVGYPHTEWIGLAEGTGANVIVANRIGREGGLSFMGGSCIVDRTLKVWTNGTNFQDTAVVGGIIRI